MKVLCVGGPLDGQTMRTRWWSFAVDATPPVHVWDDGPVTYKIVEYAVKQIANSRRDQIALIAVVSGHTVSPESMNDLYDRAVRAECVA